MKTIKFNGVNYTIDESFSLPLIGNVVFRSNLRDGYYLTFQTRIHSKETVEFFFNLIGLGREYYTEQGYTGIFPGMPLKELQKILSKFTDIFKNRLVYLDKNRKRPLPKNPIFVASSINDVHYLTIEKKYIHNYALGTYQSLSNLKKLTKLILNISKATPPAGQLLGDEIFEYDVRVYNDIIRVGCQQIPIEQAKRLHNYLVSLDNPPVRPKAKTTKIKLL